MKYRKTGDGGDLFSIIEHQQKIQSESKGVNKLNAIIDWEEFRKDLEQLLGYSSRDARKGGRPPFDPVLMFKVLVLQKYYSLSDEAVEEQIADRFSFMNFLGITPGESIPDKNTIWDFRESLSLNNSDGVKVLFNRFSEMLEQTGLVAREGSIVDASFVDVPRQRNSREHNRQIKEGEIPEGFEKDSSKGRQKDTDARWALKNKETHYGYKNHIKIDAKSKLILSEKTTTGNVHDSQVFKEIVDDKDKTLFADSAYDSDANERYLLTECDCESFILMKGARANPLKDQDKKINSLRSRIRVRVEHVFGRMKHMGTDYLRCIGFARAESHITLSNLVYNMDRYAFLRTK